MKVESGCGGIGFLSKESRGMRAVGTDDLAGLVPRRGIKMKSS